MDDQGRSDKHCRSFVLQIFDSLLPFLSTGGFPYLTSKEGWASQQVSPPRPVLVPSWLSTTWNFHAGKGRRKPAPQSLLGCLLPN